MKFIAECGLNHNGNLDLTYELIRQASWAGSDIVKFQLGWRASEGEMNCIDRERIASIIDYCHYMEVTPLFSVFNIESYDLLKDFKPSLIKIASRTIVDEKSLVDRILDDGVNLIISLGMWKDDNLPYTPSDEISYLWCISKYPSLPRDLKGFPKDFQDTDYEGYSDHTVGIETPILAISRGANIIEKHFTLDKSDVTIRDHALSATPEEFCNLVRIGKEISKQINLGI